MKKITHNLLDQVSAEASVSTRKRTNYNFHESTDDPVNRMLNAMEPGTYIRPHKHITPLKREAFLLLRGRIAYFEFSDEGDVTDQITLDPLKGFFGVEITPGVFHSLISLAPGSVLYEIKDGPYHADTDKVFAGWAPVEGSEETGEFIEKLKRKL